MYVCHTNFDLVASYLIPCGQDFILCQCSQRLQWKNFTIFVCFLTSKGTAENSSKEIATVIFCPLCPLNEICHSSGYDLSCKNEISLQEWTFRTERGNLNVCVLGTVPGAFPGDGSHPTAHIAEGGPARYRTSCL